MNLLQSKKGLVLGVLNEDSIAWQVALKAHNEGARLVLSNMPVAIRVGKTKPLAETLQAKLIPADLSKAEDIDNLVQETVNFFGGGFDFILHSVAMSNNTKKSRPYHDLDYEQYLKAIEVSALSLHRLLSACWKMDALNEGASVVTLSYIGAERWVSGYGDMAEAKAALESIVRNFGASYGKHKKVRINSVSQSPTYTPATSVVSDFQNLFAVAQDHSPLGNASASDCAAFITMMFSDYSRMVTMQNIFHDGGFSKVAIPNIRNTD